jgi:hypothetical protein
MKTLREQLTFNQANIQVLEEADISGGKNLYLKGICICQIHKKTSFCDGQFYYAPTMQKRQWDEIKYCVVFYPHKPLVLPHRGAIICPD